MLGYEAMRLQSIPVESIPGTTDHSDHLLCDLAGNAFNGSSFTQVLIALLVVFPIPDMACLQADSDDDFANQIGMLVSRFEVDQ